MLKAIDGIPNMIPSAAAETVPEYNILDPTLAPAFIPETTISGSTSRKEPTAIFTQSAGVPLTA